MFDLRRADFASVCETDNRATLELIQDIPGMDEIVCLMAFDERVDQFC